VGERPFRTPWSEGDAALCTGSWNHAEDAVPHQRVTAKRPSRARDSDIPQRKESDILMCTSGSVGASGSDPWGDPARNPALDHRVVDSLTERSRLAFRTRRIRRPSSCSGLLQFFCTRFPRQPNATTMRITAAVIVNLCKTPEINANPASAQRQSDGRRTGLKIRSPEKGVGSSPNSGTKWRIVGRSGEEGSLGLCGRVIGGRHTGCPCSRAL
jgi:hypothetical protein